MVNTKTLTLKELYKLNDDNKLNHGIEYDEGCEENDKFIEMEIVSPHNEQKLQYARVPVEIQEGLEDEKRLARTSQYHDWTSEFKDFLDSIKKMDNNKETKEEALERRNKTEIGKKYPLIVDDIEEMQGGGYTTYRTLNAFID